MRLLRITRPLLYSAMGIIMYTACDQSASAYVAMEARELARNERFDSLFFGLYLGMPSKDFYTHCWELNKKGLIKQGASNTSVYYEVPDFKHPAGMDFYPKFHNGKIAEMPIEFNYTAWAPWNKHLFADSLKLEVHSLMEKWFGTGFIKIENPYKIGGDALVKIDGNRRISIYNTDDSKVFVDIVDLPLVKEIEKRKKTEQD